MTNFPTHAYLAALGAMTDRPKDLLRRAEVEADDYGGGEISRIALKDYLSGAELNDPLRKTLGLNLARWDADMEPQWADSPAGTSERRDEIYRYLGVDGDDLDIWFSTNYPVADAQVIMITGEDWQPWYDPEKRHGRFYWDAYKKHLREVKGWKPESVQNLDVDSDRVVERLADPTRTEAFRSKGLVIGYVQSGKTATFTGVIAKAVDAGYRYVIVLTGMIELLRGQTQRRLDMELVGVENLLGDGTMEEVSADPKFDYGGDDDWPDNFMRLGADPDQAQQPSITRYTGKGRDYISLGGAADQLKPVRHRPDLPLYAPENLTRARAGIFVVKKNQAVMRKLVADLKRVRNAVKDIPVLIIDDESDQATVNTTNPDKIAAADALSGTESKDIKRRTGVNQEIVNLLELMHRAQYVGYTATPFANVFINRADDEDVFPHDFLIGLDRPVDYMGAADFSDVDRSLDPEQLSDPALSNQSAYVRDLRGETDAERREELLTALDTFTLTGAAKLYRQTQDPNLRFRHHTMLIHEATSTASHRGLMKEVRQTWAAAGYSTSAAMHRLRQLYDRDLVPVSVARLQVGIPALPPFEELTDFIGSAVGRIEEHSGNPVLVVNSDQDLQSQQQHLDFDTTSVWRILIGGAKLSRGFTVEGLTVTYFRRVTRMHDTMAQAGRWCGFRPGYRDLVRLFIGRDEKNGARRVDLLAAFDAVVRDEEEFRDQLRNYSRLIPGQPPMRPSDIPPLVSQHLFWLKPTGRAKMYHAVIAEQCDAEFGFNGHPLGNRELGKNLRLWRPVLEELGPARQFLQTNARRSFAARCGVLPAADLVKILEKSTWISKDFQERTVQPRLASLRTLVDTEVIKDFLVLFPQSADKGVLKEAVEGVERLSVVERTRRSERGNVMGEPTEPRHRGPAQRLTASVPDVPDEAVETYRRTGRGALLAYVMRDTTKRAADTRIIGFRVFLPHTALATGESGVVRYRVR